MLQTNPLFTAKEKIETTIFETSKEASKSVAAEIAAHIRAMQKKKAKCVLGLATGSTPTGVYAELVRLHKEEKLSFKNVVTFNLDEYFPMKREELQSYHRFMHEHLFDHIDIKKENVNIPDGTQPIEDVYGYCQAYEKKIDALGGIQIQILGIGRTGHIGFNEPGSGAKSVTRLITLDRLTRNDAASDFYGEENVPRRAITMGVGTILKAKRIIIMAWGEGKAKVVSGAIEGEVLPTLPASFLQQHSNVSFIVDTAAAAWLTRVRTPWVLGPIEWNSKLIRKAVTWLALELKKPILKLTDEQYNEHGLQDLLAEHGPAYKINIQVFRAMQDTITGWPGGKAASNRRAGDKALPGDGIFPKRVLIFSPHPDDDVISMGGTLLRLVDQGHEVHIAYQTSGNIAVFDSLALRFAEFVTDFNKIFGISSKQAVELETLVESSLKNKAPGQIDSEPVRHIKGLIRRGEAKAAARYCNVPEGQVHFMDMPFYETGVVRKSPLSEADYKITVDLLEKIKPHQIYAAGDLSDPHGTHRVCLSAIFEAARRVKKKAWFKDTAVWLYRGAWQEWPPEDIEMAVPLAPQELLRKRNAIFKHESQKDRALFPGNDSREFWQRAEERNRTTAKLYDQLGLAEYEGIEGFVQWHPDSE
jgi:glucosamine-6-phosphate deaminase